MSTALLPDDVEILGIISGQAVDTVRLVKLTGWNDRYVTGRLGILLANNLVTFDGGTKTYKLTEVGKIALKEREEAPPDEGATSRQGLLDDLNLFL